MNINQQANLPTITFFYTDNCERQAIAPIAEEAARRGYPTIFSMDAREYAQVGVYCQHACTPNAGFSIVLLHDFAQRHDIWPNFWDHEPWHHFDMGIVPGQSWTERWQTQAARRGARPKLGLFELGWPKADLIYRDKAEFTQAAEALRQSLGLKHAKSILYAPSWENHGKQDEFVQTFKDLPVNLLLKQAPWSKQYQWVLDEIDRMDALHRGCADNVHIIDREISIMHCFGLADVLVSDESSVLTEALLLDVPGVAVTDWLIPDCNPPRQASVPYEYVTKTKRAQMRESVIEILNHPEVAQQELQAHREAHFSHLGKSASLIMDNVEAGTHQQAFPHPPVCATIDTDQQMYKEADRLVQEGQTDAGKALLIQMAQRKTNCWEVYNDLAVMLFQEGRIEEATALIEGSLHMCPKPVVPLSNLTEIYCSANKTDVAFMSLAQLSQHIPESPKKQAAIRECMESLMAI